MFLNSLFGFSNHVKFPHLANLTSDPLKAFLELLWPLFPRLPPSHPLDLNFNVLKVLHSLSKGSNLCYSLCQGSCLFPF